MIFFIVIAVKHYVLEIFSRVLYCIYGDLYTYAISGSCSVNRSEGRSVTVCGVLVFRLELYSTHETCGNFVGVLL